MKPASALKQHLEVLDGSRGLAALSVFIFRLRAWLSRVSLEREAVPTMSYPRGALPAGGSRSHG
jgi:hypothetical protein